MGTIQLLLGRTRHRRRAAIARNWLTGLDLVGRPNFLYLTDTVRKARLVETEFVRYRAGASFPPEVDTVSGLLAALVRRFGDGRVPWDPLAVELRAERLLAERAAEWPWLARLGRHGAAALAAHHSAWDEAGQPSLPGSRGPLVEAFLRALHPILAGDTAARPMGEALRALEARLRRPDDALAEWLSRPHAVVIDDVLHPSPLRRSTLTALIEAWRAFGAHVLVCFETGRDLGGAEAGRFFGYDDLDEVAVSLRPFAATRAWRRHLFASLVEEGGTAEIVVARKDGALVRIEGGETPEATDPADLADVLYTPDPLPAEPGRTRLVRWPDPAAEVRGIAREVKARLTQGVPPADIWVAFPGLPAWLGLVRRTFGELGIPFETSAGVPVRSVPVAAWVGHLVRIAAEGFPVERTLALAGNPLAGLLTAAEAARLGRWSREQGVTAGRPLLWPTRSAPPPLPEARLAWLDEELRQLDALAAPLPALRWRDTLHAAFARWGVLERLEAEAEGGEPGPARSIAAIGRVLRAVDMVAGAAHTAHPGDWEPQRLARALDGALDTASLPDHAVGGDRVQVVGMLELRGIHPRHLWIGGLLADDFPPPPRDHWLLPRAERAPLDEPEPAQEARYLLASALRNAQESEGELTLSWCASRDGRPVAPSPLVEDLLDLPLAGSVAGERLRSRVEEWPDRDDAPWSVGELDARLAALDAGGHDPGAWHAAGGAPGQVAREPLAARRQSEGFGAWDGVLATPPPAPPSLPVTAFESYVGCPARYYYARVLGLAAEEGWDSDLPPATRGSLLHGILASFLDGLRARGITRIEGTSGPEAAALRRELHDVAVARIAADERAGLLAPALAAHHRATWLGGLHEEGQPGLLRAWLDAELASDWERDVERTEWEFPLLRLGGLAVRGRIDRVDRLADGTPVVIDYKTGQAPSARRVRQGLAIQGLLYLHAVAPDSEGVAVYQQVGRPSEVRYSGWAGDPATIKRLAPRTKGAGVDLAGRRVHVAAWESAARRLADGVFHPTLAGEQECAHCDFSRVCRVDHVRNAAIADRGDPRWQAPLPVEEG